MIRYLYAVDLEEHPKLSHQMFTHRAIQFHDRLGWDVTVDALGWETDAYDRIDPLYVIAQTPQGEHVGSMRFLPSTGPTMLADHFPDLTGGVTIRAPFIWECTRFCIAPNAPRSTAALLMAAAAELGIRMGLSHAVGVFDHKMPRIYKRLGWAPDVIGTQDEISAGIWAFTPDKRSHLAARAGISCEDLSAWFSRDFGQTPFVGAL